MPDTQAASHRILKTLKERALELEEQELVLSTQIQKQQTALQDIILQRCAIAYEQRRGIGSSMQKRADSVDWKTLLNKANSERRIVKKARTKALAELHLCRGWTAWGTFPQVLVAFELSKENPGELFWVRDGLKEVLPHIACVTPEYRPVGISHRGIYSLRFFLLCSTKGDHFKIVHCASRGTEEVIFEAVTLQAALEYVQAHLAK